MRLGERLRGAVGARLVSLLNAVGVNRAPTIASGAWFGPTLAGIRVDEQSALRLAAVWACVRVISESIAMLPWHVFRREGDKRVPYRSHVAAWLLGTQANPETTAFAFREVMLASACLYGNGYAEIERDTAGRPIWLWQLDPQSVTPKRDEVTGKLFYRVWGTGSFVDVPAANMLHLHGIGVDGITGLNPTTLGAESIALGLAMEQFGSAFFGNGSSPSGVFETESTLGEAQLTQFKEEYNKAHRGPSNARKDMVLPKGMKWKQIVVPPDESQFSESRQLQIEIIASRYRVPPHKIGHLLRSTFSNIEHQSIEFVTDCLLPWCVRLEQEANIKLFGEVQRGVAYTKIDVMGLLRGDSKTQAEAFSIGRQHGWLSANDVRRLLDMDSIGDAGDIYLAPLNSIPADMLREYHARKSEPAAPAAPVEEEDDSEDATTASTQQGEDSNGESEEDSALALRRQRVNSRYLSLIENRSR